MLQLMLYTISCIAFIYLRAEFAGLYKSLYAASKTKTGTKSAVLNNVNPVAYNELRNEPKAKIINRKVHDFKQDSATEQYKHNLLPVPQQVSFSGQSFLFNDTWFVQTGNNISETDPALQSLITELKDHISIRTASTSGKKNNSSLHTIQLTIKEGAVPIGTTTDTNRAALEKQAYLLKLNDTKIEITANAPAGLFYGVQTLLQLVKPQKEEVYLPGGEIVDWPDLEVRMIYWDDAHHLEHLDALKRAVRQAAYFKINAFALKLEGHFQYKSAPAIVEPYAYTPAQYQELSDYAKAHYVELIPYLDAPAHVSFILKHPEYAHLKAFPNSNYEFSVTNPETDTLLLRMFGDLIDANRGGKYMLLSTDEAYYVGKAEDDKKQAEALGGRGKLLAQFISRISNELHKRGRTVIIWGEYPLTPSDISALPSHLVNGVYDSGWAFKFKEHGIRQMIYTYTQGAEPLFPSYYPMSSGDSVLDTERDRATGRVEGVLKTISSAVTERKSDFMGVIVAGWADAGLHPETFWLGYATGASAGWNHRLVTAKELTARFYNSFYARETVNIDKVYQLLSRQAQFHDESWEWEPSVLRTPIFGNHTEIYAKPKPARDQTLPALPVPSDDLSLKTDWSSINKQRLQAAQKFLKENHELVDLLHENLRSVRYQHYNIEVMLSIALLCRQNLNMLLTLQGIDSMMKLSSKIAYKNASVAVSLIDEALDKAEAIRSQRNETLQSLITVWYKEWYPRVAEANGRRYLNRVDDVKDHQPARTVDMSYLIYRELHYSLDKWADAVLKVRNIFAAKNQLPIRKEEMQWESVN
ncbi:MAG TPA: glycoside hydrolase family 20 zincin-like fold domain-containing protein [Segetibacter sp.]|nr:glycoside hydrolase family 20 zincin-like fold domain-containing protein [Segetibacter sp.]